MIRRIFRIRRRTQVSKFGLHVSWSKTKIQNLGCGSTPSPVVVNGNTVEPVQDFTYLGSIQTSNRNSSSKCTRRTGLADGVTKRLDRMWNQTNLTMPTKIRIYSTCVLAVLLYSSETWTLTQADCKRLDSFHTRCQRRILHIRWYDFVSPGSLFHRSQAKTRTVWSCCQTHRGRSSKPDPSDLLRSPRRCPAIS